MQKNLSSIKACFGKSFFIAFKRVDFDPLKCYLKGGGNTDVKEGGHGGNVEIYG